MERPSAAEKTAFREACRRAHRPPALLVGLRKVVGAEKGSRSGPFGTLLRDEKGPFGSLFQQKARWERRLSEERGTKRQVLGTFHPSMLLLRLLRVGSRLFSLRCCSLGRKVVGAEKASRNSPFGILVRDEKGPFGSLFQQKARWERRLSEERGTKRQVLGTFHPSTRLLQLLRADSRLSSLPPCLFAFRSAAGC